MRPDHDVVVVGAGSAGCVVAARLSEDPRRRVLLLEAGADVSDAEAEVRGPSFFDALALPGRQWPHLLARRTTSSVPTLYARGRGTGGSGAVNAMVGLPADPEDHDRWARLGCRGWGWADVAPVLAALALPVEPAPSEAWGPVDRALVEGARSLGHPWCDDFRVPGRSGVGPAPLTRRGGERVSTAEAYLAPARARPHLEVRGDALVDRVRFAGTRACGVVLADGSEIAAGCIVLCAGAVHTPAILLRSGVERPAVGQGLQDHPAGKVVLVLAGPGDPHGLAVGTLCRFSSGRAANDLQLLALNHLGAAPEAAGLGMLMVALMDVQGRGEVRLASDDPAVDPVVELRLVEDPVDRATLRRGVHHLRRLCDTPAVRAAATAVLIDDRGTPLDALAGDDEAVDAWLRATTGDYVHASGTCRMGPAGDARSVVDPDLAVIGCDDLYVADASVLPVIPRANTHLTTVVVAERFAARFATRG